MSCAVLRRAKFLLPSCAHASIRILNHEQELKLDGEQLLALPNLVSVLTFHVIPGKILSTSLSEGLAAKSIEGSTLTFTLAGGAKVNGASITSVDIPASNGVVHLINKVRLHSAFSGTPVGKTRSRFA